MVSRSYSALAASLALLQATQVVAENGIMSFFLPDSEPLSLEASIKTVETSSGASGREIVTVMQADCPKAASPENDACRSAGIYPADVHHTRGSVWGGTTTYSADDSTTTWSCALQGGLGGKDGLEALCTKTIVSGGKTSSETASYDNCQAVAHLVPIVVTAGTEKLDDGGVWEHTDSAGEVVPISAEMLNSLYSEELSKAGCSTTTTTMFAGATAGPGKTGDAPETKATGDSKGDEEGDEDGDKKSGAGRLYTAPAAWMGAAAMCLAALIV